jgi:hypothetical protein
MGAAGRLPAGDGLRPMLPFAIFKVKKNIDIFIRYYK